MSQPQGWIFKRLIAEIEWFAVATQVVEVAFRHSLFDFAIGDCAPDVHK